MGVRNRRLLRVVVLVCLLGHTAGAVTSNQSASAKTKSKKVASSCGALLLAPFALYWGIFYSGDSQTANANNNQIVAQPQPAEPITPISETASFVSNFMTAESDVYFSTQYLNGEKPYANFFGGDWHQQRASNVVNKIYYSKNVPKPVGFNANYLHVELQGVRLRRNSFDPDRIEILLYGDLDYAAILPETISLSELKNSGKVTSRFHPPEDEMLGQKASCSGHVTLTLDEVKGLQVADLTVNMQVILLGTPKAGGFKIGPVPTVRNEIPSNTIFKAVLPSAGLQH